jgi:hypothetical protein
MGMLNTRYVQFYFPAVDDKFVAGKREFQIIAFSVSCSFIEITACFVSHCRCEGNYNSYYLDDTFNILLRRLCLISYFAFNKKKNMIPYDDTENKVSSLLRQIK